MKYFVHDLSSVRVGGDRVIFSGREGQIELGLYDEGTLNVRYVFSGVETPENLRAAARWMTQDRPMRAWDAPVSENPEEYAFQLSGGLRVTVEKKHGLVAVWRGETLIHGGPIANDDHVVPRYPARVIADGGKLLGRFNFPTEPGDAFYGLGDKSGAPDRMGRRFSMFNRDSLGYDASNSDSLYKSVPFFLKRNRRTGAMLGMFFTAACIRAIDFGRECPFFYLAEIEGGPFEYCLFLQETYREIVGAFCRLTGMPALPPLFSFGFFGSSMNYVEPDDAPQRVLDYFARTEKEKIPCEGMYFSSGYLKAPDGRRYTFLWNQQKFPNYGEYLRALSARGYHLIMNIKPGVLTTHPWYGELAEKGYFVRDRDGNPYVEFFWGGDASFVDFSNPEAKEWWKRELKEQYIRHGCEGIWNDNNELEMEGSELEAFRTRTLYPVLMSEASYEAFKEEAPNARPWIYSRAGYAGLQRFARTWSGDNVSDFTTLHYNQYMGLSLGLSGMPFFGHDLGGFFGEVPEEELMLRCCESGVFQPRFVIHSWRANGCPTEPWTYAGAAERIRALICAHYRFMPYIYDCAVEAARTGCPVDRMLSLEFPDDPALRDDDVNTLFGPWVLKVLAVEKGVTAVDVRLPAGEEWFDPAEGRLYAGGQTIRKPMPIDGAPHYLVRRGAVLPVNPRVGQLRTAFLAETEFELYPCAPGKTARSTHFEDDGRTELSLGRYNEYRFTLTERSVTLERTHCAAQAPLEGRAYTLQLPQGFAFAENAAREMRLDPDALRLGETRTFEFTGEY